jgi:hypothetical protein
MKLSLSILLVAAGAWVLTSCEEEPPPIHHTAATRPNTAPQQYPPQSQPFDPNGPAVPPNGAPPENAGTTTTTTTTAPPATQPKVAHGDYPYGIPVPNKPHLVESPYSPGKYVDVEGFAPGTEVKDPYTQKIFLVP